MQPLSNIKVDMHKLKVGFVFDDSLDKPDGVQQYILALGSWLSLQGHEVHYLVGATKRKDIPRVHSLSRNMNVRFNGNRLSMPLPADQRALKSMLREEAFDVLHVQVPYSPFMAKRILRLAPPRTAVVGTFHILPDSRLVAVLNRLLALWLRRSLRRFNAIVSVSAAAQNFAKDVYGIESMVLPNVIDYGRFHDALPFEKYDDDRLTIIFLGRLVPRKGCKTLLQAISLLSSSGLPSYRVVICGRGPLEAELKSYAKAQHLNNVEFVGFVEESDKARYYASADIAVFPSRGGESFGIVLLEAMASGRTAVLAGNNPGYASVMGAESSLLFDAHDPNKLAEKLAMLLEDKTKRQIAAQWGEKHARQYDTGKVGKQLMELYEQALHAERNVR